jgi:hypothetical protein
MEYEITDMLYFLIWEESNFCLSRSFNLSIDPD